MRAWNLRLMVSEDSSLVVSRRDYAKERGAWLLLHRRRVLTSRLHFSGPSEVGESIMGFVCFRRE
jgi:hypothetical protein